MTADRSRPAPSDGHREGLKVSRARLTRICWMLLFISLSYVIVTTAWITTENRSLLPVMELLTIWSAVTVLLFMIEIHRGAVDIHRSGSLAALLLTAAMAAVTISNHFLYLTVLPQLYPGTTMPVWLLLDGWPSITKGLECVAWALLLGLAMVFAATPARPLGRPVEWTLRISGGFALVGLIGPVSGNMNLYLLSTAGYSLGFLLLAIEVIVHFRTPHGRAPAADSASPRPDAQPGRRWPPPRRRSAARVNRASTVVS
jgi:hypothetical protein